MDVADCVIVGDSVEAADIDALSERGEGEGEGDPTQWMRKLAELKGHDPGAVPHVSTREVYAVMGVPAHADPGEKRDTVGTPNATWKSAA